MIKITRRICSPLIDSILIAAGILLITIIVLSLHWRMEHDFPVMLYLGMLKDKFGLVFYRDVFQYNMPGTLFIHYWIGKIFGYHDLGSRWLDVLVFLLISANTFFILKKYGIRTTFAAIIIFGFLYFGNGPFIYLQREYFMLIPLSFATLAVAGLQSLSKAYRGALVIGFCMSVAFLIKPQSIIVYPVFIGFWFYATNKIEKTGTAKLFVYTGVSVLAFLVPIGITTYYLTRIHGLSEFIDIAYNYWPLFSQINREHVVVAGWPRVFYLMQRGLQFGGFWIWLIPVGINVWLLMEKNIDDHLKRTSQLFLVLLAVFGLYPLLAGQLYPYHYIGFIYFASLLSAMSWFLFDEINTQSIKTVIPIVLVISVGLFSMHLPVLFHQQILGRPMDSPKHGRVDKIAEFLKKNIAAGDRVQPLDWTGGAVHAMLIAEVQPATRFLEDFYFYHHTDHVYIQNIRKKFIQELEASDAKYIIAITTEEKPWVVGATTSRDFPELKSLIGKDYHPVFLENDFIIYARNK